MSEEPGYRLGWCKPVGKTDSEYAFCYILEKISGLKGKGLEDLVARLWSLAKGIGSHSKFNFLLSDGERLFAYMNREETLHYLLHHLPHQGIAKLLDKDYEVRLEELKPPNEYAAIVTTSPSQTRNGTQ